MNNTFYKPLTPALRNEINASIEQNVSEMNTCKPTAYTSIYLTGYKALKTIINGLPDGYPIPFTRE